MKLETAPLLRNFCVDIMKCMTTGAQGKFLNLLGFNI